MLKINKKLLKINIFTLHIEHYETLLLQNIVGLHAIDCPTTCLFAGRIL